MFKKIPKSQRNEILVNSFALLFYKAKVFEFSSFTRKALYKYLT